MGGRSRERFGNNYPYYINTPVLTIMSKAFNTCRMFSLHDLRLLCPEKLDWYKRNILLGGWGRKLDSFMGKNNNQSVCHVAGNNN